MTNENIIKTVPISYLHAMDKERSDAFLLDVLPPEHFALVHIPGALNACVFYVSFVEDLTRILPDKQARVVVYGSSSRSYDAKMAVDKMQRAGYQEVYALEGGIEAWREAGYACDGNSIDQEANAQTTLSLTDGTFIVDNELSSIQWEGRNPTTSHFGTVGVSQGELRVKDGIVSGMIEVDMSSIHNINLEGDALQPVLEAHLKSDDFFFTSMFPKAVLTLNEVIPLDPQWQTSPNFHVRGELTLRGISATLDFDMTVNLADDVLQVEAHFDIDRTRWKVIYGSARFFEHLGMHKVFDLISIQLRITAGR